jgi:GDP-D-mannose dehydratase
VIATGKQYSVRDFVNIAAKELAIEIDMAGQKGLMKKASTQENQ